MATKKTTSKTAKKSSATKSKSKPAAKKAVPKKEKALSKQFLVNLSAPARRALADEGISNLKQLSKYSAAQLLELHGMGPASIPKIEAALREAGLKLQA